MKYKVIRTAKADEQLHNDFYKVAEEDKTVVIYAVVDGRREYKNMI